MSWIKITERNLAKYQAGGFVDAYKSAALNDSTLEPLEAVIASTVNKIRGYIKTGRYAVDRDPVKIPEELENDALAMIVAVAKPRIYQELTQTESANLSDAMHTMRDIAAKKFDVSTPEDPEPAAATTQSSGGCQLVRPARGVPQRSDYNGLLQ